MQECQQHIPYTIYINSGYLNLKTMENFHLGFSYRHGYWSTETHGWKGVHWTDSLAIQEKMIRQE